MNCFPTGIERKAIPVSVIETLQLQKTYPANTQPYKDETYEETKTAKFR
jgi:hypothetical protein